MRWLLALSVGASGVAVAQPQNTSGFTGGGGDCDGGAVGGAALGGGSQQVDACTGYYFDPGGPTGDYGNNEHVTVTICPQGGPGAGPSTSVLFLQWNVAGVLVLTDQLSIYNGTTVSGLPIAVGSNLNSLAGSSFTSSDPSGCLTFDWQSDLTGTAAGWKARITTAPHPGDNSAAQVCAVAAPLSLFSLLDGDPDPGGTWKDPGGAPHSDNFDPAIDVGGNWIYTQSGPGPCAPASATLTITKINAPDPGTSSSLAVCATDAPTSLFDALGGSPEAGGVWTGPGGGSHAESFDPATDPAGDYTYTVTGASPCLTASATVTVTINQPANAGSNGAITVCSNASPFALLGSLGGTPQGSGAWTGPGGTPVSGTYTPGTSTPGVYTYTVPGTPPCAAAVATVTVTQVAAPNAGTANSITVCSNNAAFSMLGQLGGTPTAGGTWSGPSGVHADSFDPAVDASGVYTYTVVGTSPCANAAATLTVTVQPAPNAGTNGAITLCSSNGVYALFNSLGGTPQVGGTWRDPSNAVHSGNFTPGTSTPGVYTYRVVGQAPCVAATATVTVTVNAAPNAGTGVTVTRCSNAANFGLFAQLSGSPQTGGTWTDPNGVAHSVTFDPGVDLPGAYTYTVIGAAPCANATAVVNVIIVNAPRAGGNGSSSVCSNAPAFDLFSRLSGTPDANGTWTAPGGAVVGNVFTPGTSTPGVYTYTVVGTAPCTNATSTVTVTVTSAPNPGTNGSISVCSNAAAVNLFSLLGGTPQAGGTWTKPGGGVHSGTYQPATEPGGNYTYTVAGAGPCANQSAVVQVVRTIAPNAGTNGSTTVCSTNGPFSLINLLGGAPNGSGSWLDPALAATSGTFTPGTSTPGVYAYVVLGTAPCVNDTGFVTVTVNTAPDAGTSASLTICDSASPFQLFDQLGGTPMTGGTWTRPNGTAHTGTFTPGISQTGGYTYTVAGLAPCINATAVVTVSVNHQPNAGNNDSFTRCSTDSPVNMFNELGGSPEAGGTWSGPSGASTGTFVPGTSTPGSYVYTIVGAAPCVNASATVVATINQAPNAGGDGQLTICEGSGAVDLFTVLTGSYDLGGQWQDEDNTGQLSGNFFDPSGLPPGQYDFEYTVDGNGQCGDDHAHVTITIVAQLDAGSNSTTSTCGSNTQVNLFNLLGGSPDAGGTWVDIDNTGWLTGQFFNASQVVAGVYHFRYELAGNGGCGSESATVTLTVVAAPDAGTNGSTTTCSNVSAFSMFPFLGGTPQAGGTWRVGAPNGPGHGATYNPATDSPNDFYYVVNGNSPCGSASAKVTVSEVQAPNAGNDGSTTVCSNGPAFNMFNLLTGSPNTGGSWFFNSLPHSATYDPSIDVQGVYTYRVPGQAPCAFDEAALTILETPGANAGCNSSITVCSGAGPFLLFNVLTCSPQNGGTWLGPNMAVHNGTYTPGTSVPGDYRYIIVGSAPCVNDTAVVSVFETASPDPGTPGNGSFCGSASAPGATVNLFTLLGGTPDPFGSWTGPAPANPPFSGSFQPGVSTPGTYTYTVTNSCGTLSSTVTVAVNAPPNAGCNSTVTACSNGGTIDMLAQLGCTPSAGGTWTGPLPSTAVVSGFFQPGISVAGIYKYTVAGAGACSAATAFLTVNVNSMPNAGNDNTLQVCSTSGQVNLFSLLGPNAQSGGSWFFNGTTPHSGVLQPGVDLSGTYLYRVLGVAPCANDEATILVQVYAAPNAGNDGLAQVCSGDGPFALINFISGGPQLNGNWTGPTGAAHSGIYDPAVNGSGLYMYRLPGNAGCAADSAYVTVIENQEVNAGNNAITVVCSDASAFGLFPLLTGGPQSGGTWYAPNGSVATGTYVPGVSAPGVYWYKLVGAAPCENDSASVTVVENAASDAGFSRLIAVCSSGTLFALVDSLGGTPDNNGAWTFNGQPHGPFFDPATDQAGAYVYTVTGVAPCATVTAQVVVTITQAKDPGQDGTLTACVGADALVLFDGLEGTPTAGGTWTNNCGLGSLVNGVFDATGFTSGSSCTFTYTHAANGPCPATSALLTLDIVNALDAGGDNATQACQGQCVDLFGELVGTPQPGGYWVNVDNAPGLIGGTFCTGGVTPGSVWQFDHVLPGSSQCDADTARVTITVLDGPFAGNNGGVNVCSISAPINLATGLSGGPDAGGAWFTPTWTTHSGTFLPATDVPGDYHYVVSGVGACPADTATVSVVVTAAADAGADAPLTICSTDILVDMFDLLGPTAQPNGNWVYVTGGNAPHNSTYNPAIDSQGIYRYSVQGSPPCPTDFAFINVTENQAPNAGSDEEITICSNQGSFSMRSQLGGSPNPFGSWVYVTGGDTPHGDFFVPGTDLPGVYRYTVTGLAPCANATALLTVNVVQAGNAGANATVEACVTQTSVDIFAALGPNAQLGGTWTDQNGSQALSGNIFDPSVAGNGTWPFTYTILGNGPCQAVSSTVTVEVGAGSSAGNDSTVIVCGSITDLDLFTQLGGDPTSGGSWTDVVGTGALLPNGILNVSLLPIGGSSPFQYTITDPGCGNVSAVVQVTAAPYPVAGTGTSLTLCSTSSPVDLFTQLTGAPQAGGVWTGPSSQVHGQTFVPASDPEGNYTYTVEGTAPCANATAVIAITVNDPPNAGTNGELLACDTLTALDLFSGLQGTPQPGGTWQDLNNSGGLTGGSLNTSVIAPGEYYYRYTVTVAGCGSTTAVVKVKVVTSVIVVDVTRTCNERDRTYTVSFTIEQGDNATYEVSGLEGTISASAPFVFTSAPLFTSQDFEAFVRDQYACGIIQVNGTTPCDFEEDVFIPESFSPNGDGVNERFLIPGIEGYPTNSLLIFNRWGAKMYEAAGYDNNTVVWDGTSPDAVISGPAPTGTYFYVLDLGNGAEPLTGYIYLNR